MQTLGVDLAADPKKTGFALATWGLETALLTDVHVGASDDDLVAAMSHADKTGIDCPLGWPQEFVAFVSSHQADHVEVGPDIATEWRKRLSYRTTDLHVRRTVPGIQGLSVSADRIGVTTMRCAALLSRLAASGRPVLRAGNGPVAEVYPAASLVRWGFGHRGYKGPKAGTRRGELVDELVDATPWLDWGPHGDVCRASDDALDAVVACLTARAAALNLSEPVPDHAQAAARTEGWIALPRLGTTLADIGAGPDGPTQK